MIFIRRHTLKRVLSFHCETFKTGLPLYPQMRHIRTIFLALVILVTIHTDAVSQRGHELGGFLGVGWYFGDLNPSFNIGHPGPAAGAIGRYNFNERLCAALTFNYTYVRGDDAWSDNPFQQARNLRFVSNVFDLGLRFEFNFLKYRHGSPDEWFTPYVFGGISAFMFNPKTQLNGRWYALRDMGTEGQFRGEEYYLLQPAINYGLGLKFDINYYWSINIEIDSRFLYTDYLDDVSKTYPDKAELLALRGPEAVALSDRSISSDLFPQIGETGRQRGDSQRNDVYAMAKVGLVYYFGQIRCPDVIF